MKVPNFDTRHLTILHMSWLETYNNYNSLEPFCMTDVYQCQPDSLATNGLASEWNHPSHKNFVLGISDGMQCLGT